MCDRRMNTGAVAQSSLIHLLLPHSTCILLNIIQEELIFISVHNMYAVVVLPIHLIPPQWIASHAYSVSFPIVKCTSHFDSHHTINLMPPFAVVLRQNFDEI